MIHAPLRHPPDTQRGMTLLELLVTVAILAAVAGIGALNLTGVIEDNKEQLARVEMQEIAKAIRQFKQDTGYYPKQGPFGLALTVGSTTYSGGVNESTIPDHASRTPAENAAWFYSPANFWQLFECPIITNPLPPPAPQWPVWLGCTGSEEQSWDASRGRGWRGPYLRRDSQSLVDLSDDLKTNGIGSPIEDGGTAKLVAEAIGIADPFGDTDPVKADPNFDVFHKFDDGSKYDRWLLDWRSTHNAYPREVAINKKINGYYLGRIGGPYFVFDLAETPAGLRPRLVSMGQNGRYGGVNGVDPCERGNSGDEGNDPDDDHDDIVLCLE
ncbi:type II secretion system protein [Thiocystis violascens]|uniref:Prepilin-type N-terminal cleavage/methylation domain-containing protein n=1 Tax=Thiocystis violascens (strain ATCC 17096 / DSM 198 / 6111) TaxID=765911 RepID=I3Y5J4_THIV6|nr:type II secretion system protein [Thiocystis violascens]AFL72262.1 prepilin-type N-terminal cleavage/methylation domain-containing protein [Thiocystis violascens DSM 198]